MCVDDLPVVVFYQAIKDVEVVATKYEQPGCLYRICQVYNPSSKYLPLTRRIHASDPGNCGDRFDHIAWLKLMADPTMFVLGIIVGPVVLYE